MIVQGLEKGTGSRRGCVAALFLWFLFWLPGCADDVPNTHYLVDTSPLPPTETPNVIFILADDLGWADLSVQGSNFYETPQLDQFSKTAVRFTNAYAASPLCSPTRASILTGQEPGRLRLVKPIDDGSAPKILNPQESSSTVPSRKATNPQSVSFLKNKYTTFAEVLKSNGYATAFMGKWHLGRIPNIPENQGFDEVVGGREDPGPPGPGHYFAPWDLDTLPPASAGTPISDVLTDAAIRYIQKNRRNPFLLCLWYYDVHAPLQAKEDLVEKYTRKLDGLNRLGVETTQRNPVMGAMIETLDANIGRLMEQLYTLKLDRRTIVIFTSDNGGSQHILLDGVPATSNAPLRNGKGSNYEGGVRVPMLVRAPGVSVPGTVSDGVVSSTDHFATILDLIHIAMPPREAVDSVSYLSALKGAPHIRPPTFSLFPHTIHASGNRPNVSMREGPWKFYKFYFDGIDSTHRYELYNLDADIGEQVNVVNDYPEMVEGFKNELEAHAVDAKYLQPRLNQNYTGNSVGMWTGAPNTVLSYESDVLSIVAMQGVPTVSSEYFVKNDAGKYIVEFEMMAGGNGKGTGSVRWGYAGDEAESVENTASFTVLHDNQWHGYSVPLHLTETAKSITIHPSESAGSFKLANVRLTNRAGDVVFRWTVF
ncbi:MAG: sulfatase [Deltaproteobacteria bacterium]|nr:sulfatase [Deltaproteobacteria bacterium]